MYWATRPRQYTPDVIILHVQTVTPMNNTLRNTMGLFLAHVKTAPPRQSAIFGTRLRRCIPVYRKRYTPDAIVTHAQTDTPINAMLYALKRHLSFFAYAGCGFNIG